MNAVCRYEDIEPMVSGGFPLEELEGRGASNERSRVSHGVVEAIRVWHILPKKTMDDMMDVVVGRCAISPRGPRQRQKIRHVQTVCDGDEEFEWKSLDCNISD